MFRHRESRHSYKKNFLFNARVRLKKLSLRLSKGSLLSFELHCKNNFISTKNPFRMEQSEYQKILDEEMTFPIQVGYDVRKDRFFGFEV